MEVADSSSEKNDTSLDDVAMEESTKATQDLWLGGDCDQPSSNNTGETEDQNENENGNEEMPPLMDTDNKEIKSDHPSSSDDSTSSEFDSDTPLTKDPNEVILDAVNLKDEGNAQFKSGDLIKATRSYRKGINVLKPLNKNNTGDVQVKSLLVSLQTNLSMVCYKQQKYKMSRDVVTQALTMDPTNVKALYRRAAALRSMGDLTEARTDLKCALQQDPNNTAVKRELVSIKKELEETNRKEKQQFQKAFAKSAAGNSFLYQDKEEEQRQKEEAERIRKEQEREYDEKRKAEWEDECVKRMSNGEDAISFDDWDKERIKREQAENEKQKEEERKKRKEQEAKRAAAAPKPIVHHDDDSSDDDEDQLTEKELSMFRGYKKTTDGRTTSYFTKELSEHEKNLIGDITPQRLGDDGTSPAAVVPAAAVATTGPARISPSTTGEGGGLTTTTSSGKKGTASAWNQAGTWEEKDATDWCTSHLQSLLTNTKTANDDDDSSTTTTTIIVAVITSVDSLTGDASVAMTGGKKRYIFDFHATLKYEIRNVDNNEVLASGTLQLPDISSTAAHDIEELEVIVSSWKKAPTDEWLEAATHCRTHLVQAVRASVQCFVKDFNAHY